MNEKDFKIFVEAHFNLPRQGPGNNEQTKKALSYMKDLPLSVKILDIGCGSGMQTLELARNLDCKIIALDLFKQFLEELDENAKKEGLSSKIETLNKSMFEFDFEPESFDVIWSEGAIYLYGFEKGLKDWSKYLKKGGYFALTECVWLKENISEISPEAKIFWAEEYPAIQSVKENLKVIEKLGLKTIAHFTLPENAWWNYYDPLKLNLDKIAKKYGNLANEVIKAENLEMDLYKNHSNEYGYEFFIIQK